MKETAVEWLLNNLHKIGVDHNLSIQAESGWLVKRNEIIEQAKAMEKEQIIDAYNNGDLRSAELYYNETYKKDKC